MAKRRPNRSNALIRGIVRLRYFLPLLMKLVYEILYLNFISETYDYLGTFASPDYVKCVVSWLVFLLLWGGVSLLPMSSLKIFTNIMMTLSMVPTLSLYWMKNESTLAFLLITLYWAIWIATVFLIKPRGSRSVIRNQNRHGYIPKANNPLMLCIFAFTIVTTIYGAIETGGLRLFINFADVYQFRLSDENQFGTIMAYLFNWNTTVLIPLCLIVHLMQKKPVFVGVDCVLMLLCYGMRGNKIVFFSLMLVVCIYILVRMNAEHYVDTMITAFLIVMMLLAMLLASVSNLPLGLMHRLLAVPAEEHYYYYDFFTTPGNPFLYLRQSILRFLMKNPYPKEVSVIIGSSTKYYLNVEYSNANNGLFSDAFQNFGVGGVMVYPVVIVFTLRFFFRQFRNYDVSVQYVLTVITLIYLLGGYYFSWLLTGGLILAIVLGKVLPKTEWKPKKKMTNALSLEKE